MVGRDVSIGPYAIIGAGVRIGDGCRVAAHAVVAPGVSIGRESSIHSFAVVGGEPQMLEYDRDSMGPVRIGDRVTVREGVTINCATTRRGATVVEDDVLLMANSHVGHDACVREHAVIANNVMIAGHVEVGAHAILGGGSGVHQFTRIGAGAMVGGNASISYDVPPCTIAVERNSLIGLNFVGLRRRAFLIETVTDLKRCFRTVFSAGNVRENANRAIETRSCGTTAEGARFLAFCAGGTRGFVTPRRRGARAARRD